MLKERNTLREWDKEERIVLDCDFDGMLSHKLEVTYWSGDDEWEFENEIFVNQVIEGYRFWDRVKHGLSYIFRGTKNINLCSTALSPDDVVRLISFLRAFVAQQIAYAEKHGKEWSYPLGYEDNYALQRVWMMYQKVPKEKQREFVDSLSDAQKEYMREVLQTWE